MSQTTDEDAPQRLCVECRQPISELVEVRLYDDTPGWKHECGVVFTPGFLADHYGLDLSRR